MIPYISPNSIIVLGEILQLTDEYSLFYLRFIQHNKDSGSDTWNQLSQTQPAKVWSGYAYENTCLKHLPNIKKALGISGAYTMVVLLSTFGLEHNKHSLGLVEKILTLDDLFL